jgi:acyl-CoA reductase-like NAD-dependent aldehyde dehydrogenase
MNSDGELRFATPAHWIDGRPVPFAGPMIEVVEVVEVAEVVTPATGAVIATVPDGTAADVDHAAAAAPGRSKGPATGAYLRPTVFANVDPDSALAREESFGPVLAGHPVHRRRPRGADRQQHGPRPQRR